MKFYRRHHFVILFIFILIICLLLNRWIWPITDEYLYASLSRSLLAGFKNEISFTDLNTEHTYLVPVIIAIFRYFFNQPEFEIFNLRLPLIFLSLINIVIIWLIANKVKQKYKLHDASWYIFMLLLIPGYFVTSVRLLIDVPLTLGITLLIYLLISNARLYWFTFALILILNLKDYGFFLVTPLLIVEILIRSLKQHRLYQKITYFITATFIVFIPVLLIAYLLISQTVLPYPRLLESYFIQYSGSFYPIMMNTFSLIFIKFNSMISSNNIRPDYYLNQIQPHLKHFHLSTYLINSPYVNESTGNILERLWQIYKINFSDQDLIIFIIPLFFTGFIIRLKQIKISEFFNHYDWIFLINLMVFLYISWHQSATPHGFRFIVPATISILYFSVWGTQYLLVKKSLQSKYFFSGFFIFWLYLYLSYAKEFPKYGSQFSSIPIISSVIQYKFVIFTLIYLVIYFNILLNRKLFQKYQSILIKSTILFLFILKIIPFYFENQILMKKFGFDNNLINLSSKLDELNLSKEIFLTNIRPCRFDFYLGIKQLPNQETIPSFRHFDLMIPYRAFQIPDQYLANLFQLPAIKNSETHYYLWVNQHDNTDDYPSNPNLDNLSKFKPIYIENDHELPLWIIYEIILPESKTLHQ
jgi:hypothetical protein